MRTLYLTKGRKVRVLSLQAAMDTHPWAPLTTVGIVVHWRRILECIEAETAVIHNSRD